jgi:AmmeMemoRadiSam system protein A
MNTDFGRKAVKLARLAAEAETEGIDEDPSIPEEFGEPSGAFVTINRYPSGDLRGCIGYPEPFFTLGEAIVQSARSACHDPRFPPLTSKEAKECVFEVTVLTPPEEIDYSTSEDLIGKIEIGRDGLIMSYRGRRGLFLPQVPVEWSWNPVQYLEQLSMKAGLSPDIWRKERVTMERFGGTVFAETSPGGETVKK